MAPSFIAAKCSLANDVDVASDGAEDVAHFGGVFHRHDMKSIHRRFQSAQRIDLSDDDLRSPRRVPASRGPCPHQP